MNNPASSNSLPVIGIRAASAALFALVLIFGVKSSAYGVPIWIVATPFVLLASLDIESSMARGGFTSKLISVAFHFVIVATLVAAQQQFWGPGADAGGRNNVAVTSKPIAGTGRTAGCGAGGCGSAGAGAAGKSGCGCGAGGKATASAMPTTESACGCGGGKPKEVANHAEPTKATPMQRTQTARPPFPAPVNRAGSPQVSGMVPAGPLGPKLGAGMPGVIPRDPAIAPGGVVVPLPPRDATVAGAVLKPGTAPATNQPAETATPPPSARPLPAAGGAEPPQPAR